MSGASAHKHANGSGRELGDRDARDAVRESQAIVAEAVGVSKRFGATRALENVSLAVDQGEVRALLGRNGAGKSTLVSILTGLVRPDEGEVRFLDAPAPKPDDREAWRQHVACVFQKLTLLPNLTVAENLFVNAQPRRRLGVIDWRRLRSQAEQLLEEWDVRVPSTVEAGQLRVEDRQRLEIARALASGSRFLILDEPTARLERPAIRRLFDHIRRLRSKGIAILYISHHLEEVFEVCDSLTVLRDGSVVHAGSVEGLDKPALVAAMVGRSAESPGSIAPARPSANARGETTDGTLRVDGVSVDGWCSGISFDVRPGELVGLAGLAGSGKAQVAEVIAGLRRPNTGQVLVGDRPVPLGDVQAAIRHGIGFVPQDRHTDGFAPNLSVEENITLSVLPRLGRFGFVSPRRRRELAGQLTAPLEVVAAGPTQLVSELSGGNQQKVVVGRALVSKPRVLVVASPTAGVDVASKAALFRTLMSMPDVAILVVSDELDELGHCGRILVMFDGRLTKTFDTWSEHELVAAMEGVEDP